MEKQDQRLRERLWCRLAALLYVLMIVVNILAEKLPIGGRTTAEVSARYPTLITPSPGTFLIWLLIYALLLLYTLYQAGVFQWGQGRGACATELTRGIAPWYCLSSLANMLWIVAWHFGYILVSVVLNGILLYSLVRIMLLITGERLCLRERLFVKLPFSVYFGWILVAVIVNIAALLVSLKWNGGIPAQIWAIGVLALGAALALFLVFRLDSPAIGFVFIWAYAGILAQHTAFSGWDGAYPNVITAAIASLAALCAGMTVFLYRRKNAS